jgi:hypothetical protein
MSFIHSIAMCRMRWFLAVLRSFFHCSSLLYTISFHPFSPTSLPSCYTSSCHLFLGVKYNLVGWLHRYMTANYNLSLLGRSDASRCLISFSWFIRLSILIGMYVTFCVFCLIVLFCVLFVCKCVLYYFHQDIGALFDYPNWGFSMRFPQL